MTTNTKDGPIKKFYLIKAHGTALRAAGYEPLKMSCKEIEAALESGLADVIERTEKGDR